MQARRAGAVHPTCWPDVSAVGRRVRRCVPWVPPEPQRHRRLPVLPVFSWRRLLRASQHQVLEQVARRLDPVCFLRYVVFARCSLNARLHFALQFSISLLLSSHPVSSVMLSGRLLQPSHGLCGCYHAFTLDFTQFLHVD